MVATLIRSWAAAPGTFDSATAVSLIQTAFFSGCGLLGIGVAEGWFKGKGGGQ